MCITCIIIPHVIHSVIYRLDIIQYKVNVTLTEVTHKWDPKYQYNVHNITCIIIYMFILDIIQYKVNVYNVTLTKVTHNWDPKYQYNVHNMHNNYYTTLYTCYTQMSRQCNVHT